MGNKNRYLSFELVFALLFIVAFFLPWLNKWGVEVVGWDIPELQKKVTKVTNLLRFFSKNKDWIYSTHVVYLIPLLSTIVMVFWLALKQKTARIFLFIASVLSFVVSLNLFYKLPGYGSGVYLLCGSSILSIIYLIIVFYNKKRDRKEPIDMLSEIEGEKTKSI